MTGASEGIGKSFAITLAKLGYNVTLVARNEDKMQRVAATAREANPNIQTRIVPLDV